MICLKSCQTEEENAMLYCWYETKSDPALYIYPIKSELLSKMPYIVQMYDVISESSIQDLRERSHSVMRRSKLTKDGNPGGRLDFSTRTSVDGWIYTPVPKLTKFIEVVTGLSVEPFLSSEAYVVAQYAFGGHFICHLDSVRPDIHI